MTSRSPTVRDARGVRAELIDAYDKTSLGSDVARNARAISRLMQIALEDVRESPHAETLYEKNKYASDIAHLAAAAGVVCEMLDEVEDLMEAARLEIREVS